MMEIDDEVKTMPGGEVVPFNEERDPENLVNVLRRETGTMIRTFKWDDFKAWTNIEKHGIKQLLMSNRESVKIGLKPLTYLLETPHKTIRLTESALFSDPEDLEWDGVAITTQPVIGQK